MDNILNIDGKKIDMNTINYFKDLTNGKGLVAATEAVKNDGTSETLYGNNFDLYDRTPGGLPYSISFETNTPTTNYLNYCINLNQINSVNINFDQLDKEECLAFLKIAFKDDSSLVIEDNAKSMCNSHITPFIHGITYCNGHDECGEMDIKDMENVAFDINVATDRTVPIPEGHFKNFDVLLLENLKREEKEGFFPEGIKVKEMPVESDNLTANFEP